MVADDKSEEEQTRQMEKLLENPQNYLLFDFLNQHRLATEAFKIEINDDCQSL